jgi:hypothetical protein
MGLVTCNDWTAPSVDNVPVGGCGYTDMRFIGAAGGNCFTSALSVYCLQQ